MRAQQWIRGIAGAGIALLGACSSPTDSGGRGGGPYVITLTPISATIDRGKTLQIKATVIDIEGNAVNSASLAWTSSDQRVASVASGGMVQGAAEGATQIVASWQGANGTSLVTVVKPTTTKTGGCPLLAIKANIPGGGEPGSGCQPR
jgi:Big-like domain-containing protein